MTSLDGNERGMTAACIYELKGEQLKLCIPYFYNRVDPSKRPTEFKTKDGDGLMLYVLERLSEK
jgi:RNA polymerase sigma-70 factor (ECF subfamily)